MNDFGLSTIHQHAASWWRVGCLAMLLPMAWTSAALALPADGGAAAAQPAARQWAILIGVEKYQKASPLSFTINDVQQIARTLHERGGVPKKHIVTFVDSARKADRQPLRATLKEQLPDWLRQPGPDDQVLLYFSGHGFRDDAGRLYLAPIDCDPKDPAATGIAVSWFRDQVAACRARFKLLVLDACHAGSEKGDEPAAGIAAKDLGEPFRDLEGVVTLASSTAQEKSLIWAEKQQSLFSYWLNTALKGHADSNGDGQVDLDEMNNYVHRNVSRTAEARFDRAQTPVRIVRSGTPGVPVVLHLQPLTLKQVLSDIAEQLSWSMHQQQLSKVGVLEFTTDTKIGEALGADFGALGRFCAAELEQQLMLSAAGSYSVVDNRRLVQALQRQKFSLAHLSSAGALTRLSEAAGGMPAIALGTLRNRSGRVVTIQCRLMQTDDDSLAGMAGGTAYLNESEWAMLGRSVAVNPEDRPAPQPGLSQEDALIARLDEKSSDAHPMSDRRFPYRVTLRVNGKDRRGVFRGNDLIVPMKKGEHYQVIVENRSGEKVMMRLLVDGLNTLPEKDKDETKGITTYQVAKRVSLDEARHWILDPKVSRIFAVDGFITETGTSGKQRMFRIVDAGESWAARQNFTDGIGVVSAAFYSPGSDTRAIGTAGDDEETNVNIHERKGTRVGQLLGVVHLKYVDADEFEP